MPTLEEVLERAKAALGKPPEWGPDPGVGRVVEARIEVGSSPAAPEPIARLGAVPSRAGGYVQVNERIVYSAVAESFRKLGVVIMPLREAMEEGVAAKWAWRLIPPDLDRYVAAAAISGGGAFIYVPPGVKVKIPLNISFAVTERDATQPVHNVVVVDRGAELHVVFACAAATSGLHIGVTELYVAEDAMLTYTMIHSWPRGFVNRGYTAARVEARGRLEYYYVALSTGDAVVGKPRFHLAGEEASAYSASVLLVPSGSRAYSGATAVLSGEDSSAELVSRFIAARGAYVEAPLEVIAEARSTGHTDCSTLLLGDARVKTTPSLEARHPDAQLSHEAAIGRVSEDAVTYLESKGLTEEEATALLVYGFASSVEIKNLPEPVKKTVEGTLRVLARKATG